MQLLQEAPGRTVPSERTLQRWFVRADLSPAPAGRPPRVDLDRATSPHEIWQMDAKEHIRLSNNDDVSWLRLIDECSGAVLWTAVFPPGTWGQVSPEDVREQLRLAFVRWGLPGRFRVRQRLALGGPGRLPHRAVAVADRPGRRDALEQLARRPQENGVVERSQGISARWYEPWTCRSAAELQTRSEEMDRLYREVYPYRGGRSRLEVFPGLVHSGRRYDRGSEAAVWEWSRVAEHLAGIVSLRRVDGSGRVSVYNRNHYVGRLHQGKDVYVMYDPDSNEWVFADREGRLLNRRPADQLSPERVMSLNVSQRR